MPRLNDDELDEFFRWREKWKEGEPLHPRTEDVAEFHILPKLGDGRQANLQRSGVPTEEATIAGAAFKADVKKFLRDEPRDEVINTIVTAMFKPDSRFTYDPNKNAVLYFAQMAEVDVQRLRKTGWETIALEDHEGQGHEVSDAVSPYFPRPESIIDKVDLQAHIQRRLGKAAGNKWLVLLLLHRGSAAGYEWQEIGWALQGTAPPGGWAQAGQKGAAQPRNPAEVWGDIKSGFDLPDWITVRGWFPPPPPNAGALRKWYCDGAKKLKRGD